MAIGIQRIFVEASPNYESANRAMTFYLDILWRRIAAAEAASHGGAKWLDVCSGTGEMALYLHKFGGGKRNVAALDFCLPMLDSAASKHDAKLVSFSLANATVLPFQDNSFDLVTIAFATRNINLSRKAITATFGEFHRVLKPGGMFLNLETSQPESKLLKRFFHFYVDNVARRFGQFISGSKRGYAYLSSTVRRFYTADELAQILKEAGFKEVGFRRLMLGVAAIHKALK
ncbi:MAG: ubiquinone/menaquinone biosynthesis methyltransferase [Candidatus Thorarchaeota archaeon]|nr:MAG: ubiquinone/menaquinone biosynthesis methyltransferase [Candidatus Thorarchaeota archaeon]